MFLPKKENKENIQKIPNLSPENTLDFHSPLCQLVDRDISCLFHEEDTIAKNIARNETEEKMQAYQLRHKVFCEELKWVPKREDGLEIDNYDNNAIFFGVFINRRLLAFLRLILSDGHFMIEKEFSSLVDSTHKIQKTNDTAEISRLCVAPEARNQMMSENFSFHNISMLLYKSVYHWCNRYNIKYLYLVVETKIYRLLRIQGFPCMAIGEPKIMPDKVIAIAAIIDLRKFEILNALKQSETMRWFFTKNYSISINPY